jgi:RNA polymerase sigma factor (sigma-70 family)
MSGVKEFAQYYEAHKKAIFTYILYRVSFNRDLLKAFEYFHTFDKERPFKPWIYRIAHNHLINHFTAKKNQKMTSIDDIPEIPVDAKINKQAQENMLMEKIEIILKDLPEAHQELLLLRYQNGLSHKEVAEIVGKEEGAVRTAISRALDTVRQKYHISTPPEKNPS